MSYKLTNETNKDETKNVNEGLSMCISCSSENLVMKDTFEKLIFCVRFIETRNNDILECS